MTPQLLLAFWVDLRDNYNEFRDSFSLSWTDFFLLILIANGGGGGSVSGTPGPVITGAIDSSAVIAPLNSVDAKLDSLSAFLTQIRDTNVSSQIIYSIGGINEQLGYHDFSTGTARILDSSGSVVPGAVFERFYEPTFDKGGGNVSNATQRITIAADDTVVAAVTGLSGNVSDLILRADAIAARNITATPIIYTVGAGPETEGYHDFSTGTLRIIDTAGAEVPGATFVSFVPAIVNVELQDSNKGLASANTPRVVIASDDPLLTDIKTKVSVPNTNILTGVVTSPTPSTIVPAPGPGKRLRINVLSVTHNDDVTNTPTVGILLYGGTPTLPIVCIARGTGIVLMPSVPMTVPENTAIALSSSQSILLAWAVDYIIEDV